MEEHKFRILVVDDQAEYRDVLKLILKENGYRIDTADSGENALNIIQKNSYNLVITDLIMDGINGIELLKKIKYINKELEVIIITGYGSIENAVKAMKEGAFSYFIKSHSPKELLNEIKKVVQISNHNKKSKIPKISKIDDMDYFLDSKSSLFNKTLTIARKAAKSNSNVLILGESGVGKEVIAKYIYKNSKRRNLNYVDVNCHGFSETLFESEFFGHEKGSFTGAYEKRIGRFELADKGVLFLDEIGNISMNAQSKILKAIENKKIERVGSNKSIEVDFRLITATNKNLSKEIEINSFREDLYYRISTITISIPPLRKRSEDILDLTDYFIKKFSLELNKKITGIEEPVKKFLMSYDFPGNVRELKNIIERMIVLSENGSLNYDDIANDDISNDDIEEDSLYTNVEKMSMFDKEFVNLKEIRKKAESNYIKKVLEVCDYNVTESAKKLGISRRQLFNKISEYRLK